MEDFEIIIAMDSASIMRLIILQSQCGLNQNLNVMIQFHQFLLMLYSSACAQRVAQKK